jgi:hypothetical protein
MAMERAPPPVVVVDHRSAVARVDVTASVSHSFTTQVLAVGMQARSRKRRKDGMEQVRNAEFYLGSSNIPLPQIKTVPFDPASMTFSDNGSCKQASVLTEEHVTLHELLGTPCASVLA